MTTNKRNRDVDVGDNKSRPSSPASSVNEKDKTIPFLRRLTDMLQENKEAISFSPGKVGQSLGQIVVHDRALVESKVLPKYFNHASFASLRRQLNYFSFARVGKGRQRGATYCNDFVVDLTDILRLKRRSVVRGPRPSVHMTPNDIRFGKADLVKQSMSIKSMMDQEVSCPVALTTCRETQSLVGEASMKVDVYYPKNLSAQEKNEARATNSSKHSKNEFPIGSKSRKVEVLESDFCTTEGVLRLSHSHVPEYQSSSYIIPSTKINEQPIDLDLTVAFGNTKGCHLKSNEHEDAKQTSFPEETSFRKKTRTISAESLSEADDLPLCLTDITACNVLLALSCRSS